MARHTVEVAEIFALDLAKAEDVGDGHGAEIEIGAVGHAQRSRTVVIVDVATIDAVGSECLLSVHKWLEGGDRSEEHTSELQSLMRISYAVFCLKKKKNTL